MSRSCTDPRVITLKWHKQQHDFWNGRLLWMQEHSLLGSAFHTFPYLNHRVAWIFYMVSGYVLPASILNQTWQQTRPQLYNFLQYFPFTCTTLVKLQHSFVSSLPWNRWRTETQKWGCSTWHVTETALLILLYCSSPPGFKFFNYNCILNEWT